MARSTLPGQTMLQGRYRVEHTLGSGGFGVTYYGYDVRLDRPVAIKEYFPEQFASRDHSLNVTATSPNERPSFELGRGWFLREAQTLAQFRHPNIVAIIDHFEENATAYMVLAFERGRPMTQWLAELRRPPSQAEIDAVNGPLFSALDALHQGGYLHRDVASDNIILRPDGSPVLIDFGSARQAESRGTRTAAVVKLGYSPFEQYSSDTTAQGPWSDMYALAATWHLAITGHLPPDAPERMLEDIYKPLAKGDYPGYRRGFLSGLDWALKPNFKDRPRTIGEWRQVLQADDGLEPAYQRRVNASTAGSGLRDNSALTHAAATDRPARDPSLEAIDAALIFLAVIANITFWVSSGQRLYTSSAADILDHHLPPVQWIALAAFLLAPIAFIIVRRWHGPAHPKARRALVAYACPWMLFPLTYVIGICLLLLALSLRQPPRLWHRRAVVGIGGVYILFGWLVLLSLLWKTPESLSTVFPLLAAGISGVGLAGIVAMPHAPSGTRVH